MRTSISVHRRPYSAPATGITTDSIWTSVLIHTEISGCLLTSVSNSGELQRPLRRRSPRFICRQQRRFSALNSLFGDTRLPPLAISWWVSPTRDCMDRLAHSTRTSFVKTVSRWVSAVVWTSTGHDLWRFGRSKLNIFLLGGALGRQHTRSRPELFLGLVSAELATASRMF